VSVAIHAANLRRPSGTAQATGRRLYAPSS
jgi:hypothetical protein